MNPSPLQRLARSVRRDSDSASAEAEAETSAQPWALAHDLPPALPASRLLRCAAGFHHDERAARELAHGLRHDLGLSAAQMILVRPADADPARYRTLARRWACQPAPAAASSTPGRAWATALLAVLGVGMPSLLVAGGALPAADGAADWALGLGRLAWQFLAALLTCAVLFGWGLTAACALRRPPGQRFDRALQRALRRGDWAVVVHDLPAALHADVATALRHNSRCWCAQAPRRPA